MESSPTGLVDIVRDFLEAHQLMQRLFGRYRRDDLRFAELEELVGNGEGSVLFRLKERCHTLFRTGEGGSGAVRREVLLDLAVGSLFHEAMKFRESFYQREVYGPRVRALQSEEGVDGDALFRDFEKMLAAVSPRLEEGLRETEALLNHVQEQLKELLVEHREHGHVTRYLLENRALVEDVFGEGIDALLDEIHGEAAKGYALAGRSYLASGYYQEAKRAFAEALARGGERGEFEHLSAYARGMAAYLAGDYGQSVEWLGKWIEATPESDVTLAELAHAAVSKVGQLAPVDEKERITAAASSLLERLASARGLGGVRS
jgi:tetratricopeptide (TPR) repeat protein